MIEEKEVRQQMISKIKTKIKGTQKNKNSQKQKLESLEFPKDNFCTKEVPPSCKLQDHIYE